MTISPALEHRSLLYPKRFRGRVPKRIRILTEVRSDMPIMAAVMAMQDEEYDAWTNAHGAVSAILSDGTLLGVKPREFEVIEWFPEAKP